LKVAASSNIFAKKWLLCGAYVTMPCNHLSFYYNPW